MDDIVEVGDRPPAGPACAGACRRHAALAPVLGGVGWLAAAVGALLVADVPVEAGESLCGVWGCFPPLPALAALHLFWAAVVGAAVWAVWGWQPAFVRPAAAVLLVAAVATAAVLVGNNLDRWLGVVPADARHFWPRRVGYVLATRTDFPVVQAAAAGLVGLLFGRRAKQGAS